MCFLGNLKLTNIGVKKSIRKCQNHRRRNRLININFRSLSHYLCEEGKEKPMRKCDKGCIVMEADSAWQKKRRKVGDTRTESWRNGMVLRSTT